MNVRERGRITVKAVAVRLSAVLAVCVVLRLAAASAAGFDGIPDKLGTAILAVTLPGAGLKAPGAETGALASAPSAATPSGSGEAPSRLPEETRPAAASPPSGDSSDAPSETAAPPPETGPAAGAETTPGAPVSDEPQNAAIGTTITGKGSSSYQDAGDGIYLNNKTAYDINAGEVLARPLGFSAAEGAAVLIIHTHASEAYNPAGEDVYVPSDPSRTEDTRFNVVRVGDELEEVLTARGISVIHDRELYDYPSYTGSYDRSMASIKRHLEEHPEIRVVIDLHRDALEGDGKLYKTVADVGGDPCAQVMLICGSDYSGLNHPNWRDNLTFAMKLQRRMVDLYPTLARPLKISQYRYNQDATTGSLIAEIGTNGNTLREALAAVSRFGECLADVLTGV